MDHLATEGAWVPIVHPAVCGHSPDARPYKLHRNRRGSPRWYQRWFEAWWILTGEWSLHRAWQAGQDLGSLQEYRRIIVNGGDLIPIMNAAFFAARAATPNGSRPSEDELRALRHNAWQRYRENPLHYLHPDKELGEAFSLPPDFSAAASSGVSR